MDSSYSLTEHVRPEDGVGLPCTDKTPCRPCYGVPETDCGSAPVSRKALSLPSGRVGSFSLLLLAHHPKVVCKLLI